MRFDVKFVLILLPRISPEVHAQAMDLCRPWSNHVMGRTMPLEAHHKRMEDTQN